MDYDCDKCKHKGTELCDDCSVLWDTGCCCHTHPPCAWCVNNNYEELEEK